MQICSSFIYTYTYICILMVGTSNCMCQNWSGWDRIKQNCHFFHFKYSTSIFLNMMLKSSWYIMNSYLIYLQSLLSCSCYYLSHILPFLHLSRFLKPVEDLNICPLKSFYLMIIRSDNQIVFSVCQSFIFKNSVNSHLLFILALCSLQISICMLMKTLVEKKKD